MTRILIVGAGGVLGSAATKEFLKNDFLVRAFVRSNANELEKIGAEIFVGDLINPQSVIEACNGTNVIITAAHGMLGKGKNKSKNVDDVGHKTLIDAALKAGVEHFIYTSLTDASKTHPIDFFRTKYNVEQYLIKSGLNYTILRLAPFMEWHVHNLLGKSIEEKGRANILGAGNNPTNFIAVQDVLQALEIIVGNKTYYNKILNIGGPENISRNEIVNLYANFLRISPHIKHLPIQVVKVLSKLIGPFHPGIGRIMKVSAYYDEANATMNTSDSIQQFGLPPTTIKDFIKKQLRIETTS